MTTAKRKKRTQGSAARYRALKEQQLERLISAPVADDEPLFEVETPSGMVWQCRKPNLFAFVEAGALPQSLATKLAAHKDAPPEQQAAAFRALSPQEQTRLIVFQAMLVRNVAVDPRIVELPQADNEIAFDEVTQADFIALANWAVTGGVEAIGLGNFPSE